MTSQSVRDELASEARFEQVMDNLDVALGCWNTAKAACDLARSRSRGVSGPSIDATGDTAYAARSALVAAILVAAPYARQDCRHDVMRRVLYEDASWICAIDTRPECHFTLRPPDWRSPEQIAVEMSDEERGYPEP